MPTLIDRILIVALIAIGLTSCSRSDEYKGWISKSLANGAYVVKFPANLMDMGCKTYSIATRCDYATDASVVQTTILNLDQNDDKILSARLDVLKAADVAVTDVKDIAISGTSGKTFSASNNIGVDRRRVFGKNGVIAEVSVSPGSSARIDESKNEATKILDSFVPSK